MVPEWFAVLTGVMMWIAGFIACGMWLGEGSRWDGIRSGFTLGLYDVIHRRKD